MNHRIDLLEQDMAAIKVVLEDVHAHYARREDVAALGTRTAVLEYELSAVKSSLNIVLSTCARREDVEELAVRTGTLEQDMATVKTSLEVVRSNYARREDVQAVLSRVVALEERLDSELPHLATKAELSELRSEMRAWMVGTAITLFIALATLQFSFYQLLKSSINEQVHAAVQAAIKLP